ncbi:MAG TPA: FAD-binding oxidoreductase [Usitatibacter sp.]|nr:FAD-binding oxidoreductase [Usitatibacter sp.]
MRDAEEVLPWGNYPRVRHAAIVPVYWRHQPLPSTTGTMLPLGLARSYGDSALNEGGTLLATRGLDRLAAFDREHGVVRCEAGVPLGRLLEIVEPHGWSLPVVPGTAHVTVGGALANDVHGKNHHVAGTFGHHVARFELLRSDRGRVQCSPTEERDLFRATLGGLGLTGLITWADLQLRRIPSQWVDVETRRMAGLDEFFALSAESAAHEYTVAWIDALARGGAAGRGLFMRANPALDATQPPPAARSGIGIPFDWPAAVLNRHAVRAFNALYIARGGGQWRRSRQPTRKFLFPLDGIARWNRMYGKAGFLQHQSVVPRADAASKLREMLAEVARSGGASFLTVLKVFGEREPAGLLSFARPGVTLALDLPMRGEATLALLERLDAVVRDAGGAIYPAKDARMSPATFRASFPALEEFARHVDPAFSSSLWRRVHA